MTKDQLKELERLRGEATGREWVVEQTKMANYIGTPKGGGKVNAIVVSFEREYLKPDALKQVDADAQYIAALHNAAPALIEAAEQRDKLHSALCEICHTLGLPCPEYRMKTPAAVARMAAELAEAKAVVDKLPKTADGVPVQVGTIVYPIHCCIAQYVVNSTLRAHHITCRMSAVPMDQVYSTCAKARAAAEAAQKGAGDGKCVI